MGTAPSWEGDTDASHRVEEAVLANEKARLASSTVKGDYFRLLVCVLQGIQVAGTEAGRTVLAGSKGGTMGDVRVVAGGLRKQSLCTPV